MSAIDIPPGIGLRGTALGMYRAPIRARRLARAALALVILLGGATWALVAHHPYHRHAATQVVLPFAFAMFALLGFIVRSARLEVTRDGVRWGWDALHFTQSASRLKRARVWTDGVTLESKRGGTWFLGARDWDRFDALVRQLRRAELPVEEHAAKAPLRARMQSYGRFLDGLLVGSIVSAMFVALWAL
ncbi:MAG TPA: hypothetical protein VGL61_35435 [Kofleriaceae bacterium]